MREVAIAGVGMTSFGKFLDRSLKELAAESIGNALKDAGIGTGDVQAAFSGNSMAGIITGQESVRGQTVLVPLGIRGIPVFNVENACATSSSALHLAWMTVASGSADIALAFGMEKLYHQERERSFRALAAAADIESDTLSDGGSPFMEMYAEQVRGYMKESEATARDFAEISVKNREHAALNPYAQFRDPITAEQVLESPMIADPLTRLMCSPIGDGSAAVVLVRADAAPDAVRIAASMVRSGGGVSERESVSSLARAAYEMAGLSPADVHVAEVHDAASPAELLAYEDLGFCAPGQGAEYLRSGATRLGGERPVNPSGGLVSRGHPVGATGVAQIVELVWQLRGEAGERQVDGAGVALAENAGGNVGHDAAAVAIHILRAP
jgi:acetyl-CoA acyltransferase